jgi:hypothetical protein
MPPWWQVVNLQNHFHHCSRQDTYVKTKQKVKIYNILIAIKVIKPIHWQVVLVKVSMALKLSNAFKPNIWVTIKPIKLTESTKLHTNIWTKEACMIALEWSPHHIKNSYFSPHITFNTFYMHFNNERAVLWINMFCRWEHKVSPGLHVME